MLRKALLITLVVIIALVAVLPVAAHRTGPCNDSDGDGAFSGREYAEHHITEFAKAGDLGDGGHKPGSHKGFSACLGVH
jgi:hypothetical protein